MSQEIVPYGAQRYSNDNHSKEPQIIQRNFALFHVGSCSEDDRSFVSELVKSGERMAPDVLYTLRYFIQWGSVVAIAMIVGYCLVETVPHLVLLLSRVLVDLPLGILSALCSLLIPLLDLVFVQLPLAIGHGVLAIGHGLLWVLSSVGYGLLWVLSSVGYGLLWVLSSVGYGLLWVLSSVGYGLLWVVSSVLYGILWVVSSVLYFIFMCITLPFSFLYNIALVEV